MKKRRNVMRLLAIMLTAMMMLALIAACADDSVPANGGAVAGTDPEQTAPTGDDPPADAVHMAVWHYFSSEAEDIALQTIFGRFNDLHPGIYVSAMFVARDDLLMQYTLGVVSGDLPDIGMVDNPDHA